MTAAVQMLHVDQPAGKLAELLHELAEVMDKHSATGIQLVFAPDAIDLPEGWVLVQQYNTVTRTFELVPTPLNEVALDAVLHDATIVELDDREFVAYASMPGRVHGCSLGRRGHTHKPMK